MKPSTIASLVLSATLPSTVFAWFNCVINYGEPNNGYGYGACLGSGSDAGIDPQSCQRNLIFVALLGQLATAQLIDLKFIEAQPDPAYTIATDQISEKVPYDQAATIAKDEAEVQAGELPLDVVHEKRSTAMRFERRQAACAALPTTPNVYNADLSSAKAFSSDANLAAKALGAVDPEGYKSQYVNKKASAQFAQRYMGFVRMTTYDVNACAKQCNDRKLCQAFNIYFARDPSQKPVSSDFNVSGWQRKFQTAVAGSNSYVKSSSLSLLSKRAINAPLKDCTGEDPDLGMRAFTDNAPFDPARCVAICAETNEVNTRDNDPRRCRFYDTYILHKNNRTQGVICSLYTRAWDPSSFATNDGQYDDAGAHFTIHSSTTSTFSLPSSPEPPCGPPSPPKDCTPSSPVAFQGSLTSAPAPYSDRFSRSTLTAPFPFCIFSVCVPSIEVSISGFMSGHIPSDPSTTWQLDLLNAGWAIERGEKQYMSIATCGSEGSRVSKAEWRMKSWDGEKIVGGRERRFIGLVRRFLRLGRGL
ncbi:hypothetical protein Slin14017_G018780 [Septoria linicola]|nr:hypothetical protein Slin14017_G018780 [Septoria linicola]